MRNERGNLHPDHGRMSRSRGKALYAAVALAAATFLAFLPTAPVVAHHGWSSFDTRRAFYVTGTVTYVRWGNPHSEVTLRIEKAGLPANWAARELPQGADERDGRATMASARPYEGEHSELHLVLVGPSWMERWGLNRPLRVGERIEAVGYVSANGADDLRPVMFWLADGQGVWQQLTAFPQRPEPAPQGRD
ncbi:DUF6152 family protein [Microvirga vignae]|uniref:DUF6152 family protein n=1 Tax=Microvirga vignae TaxID=1225564 RepID=UPI00069C9190|nr:DUF6152 family protein [Microvirga vignae]